MNAVCVDASLALAWLLVDQHTANADRLRRRWQADSVEMVGPSMFSAEVTSTLREYVFFKRILPHEGETLLAVYERIPIRIVEGPGVYRHAWRMARELNLPVCYDMLYLAVAEIEDCDFWTADERLVNAVGGREPRVHWVGEA